MTRFPYPENPDTGSSMLDLSMEVAIILTALSEQRAREMLSLISIKNIKFVDRCCIVIIGDHLMQLETSKGKHYQGEFIFSVKSLKIYLEET